MQYTFAKDPDEVLDYSIDWTNELATSETISTSSWTVVTSGITKDSDSITGNFTTVILSGGTAGEEYELVNTIETNQNRTHSKTLVIPVTEQ